MDIKYFEGGSMKVYLVRHGECDSNLRKIYNYKGEILNNEGIKQAEFLRKKIASMQFDIIYSSPLLRAKQTAEILNDHAIKIIYDERLREREPGDLEGKSIEDTNREEYWNYYTTIKYGTEERIPDLFSRVANFLDELKKKDYERVLIIAHSGVSKAFSAYFEGIQDGMFLNRGLKNCEIKEYKL